MPEGATVTKEQLMSRLVRGDPTLREKLEAFAEGIGVDLTKSDRDLVARIGRWRSKLVHGSRDATLAAGDVRRFEHLVEKLLFAAADRFAGTGWEAGG